MQRSTNHSIAVGLFCFVACAPTRSGPENGPAEIAPPGVRFEALSGEHARSGKPRVVDVGAMFAVSKVAASVPIESAPPTPRSPAPPKIPDGTVRRTELSSTKAFSTSSSSAPGPTKSFQAASYSGWIPPDVHGAVGPRHIMTTHNGFVGFQDRVGNSLGQVSLIDFFSTLGSGDVFDPRVVYDRARDRWITIAAADRRSPSSSAFVAVSLTGDPTAQWAFYSFDGDPTDLSWVDYPMLGLNGRWIVVQANMFDGPFGSLVLAIDKDALYAAEDASVTRFRVFEGHGLTPAVVEDDSTTSMVLLQSRDGGAGALRMFSIDGAIGNESLTLGPAIVASERWSGIFGYNIAPQLGADAKLELIDDRIQNVVVRDGTIWATHHIFVDPVMNSAVQWWQLGIDGAVQQRGRIVDGGARRFYGYPSIAVNKNHDLLIGYARFSPDEYASGYYSLRRATDPPNTFRPDTLLKAGEAPYDITFGTGRNRWGDYTATVVDPANDTSFWTIQEYAASFAWGTWWGNIDPVACVGGDGAACDDGDACTSGDSCRGGVCVGGVRVTCPSSGCATGACDAATGRCVTTAHAAGTICRGAAGPCDVAEVCNGASNDCPADHFAAASTPCTERRGACPVVGMCIGTDARCEADGSNESCRLD